MSRFLDYLPAELKHFSEWKETLNPKYVTFNVMLLMTGYPGVTLTHGGLEIIFSDSLLYLFDVYLGLSPFFAYILYLCIDVM